MSAALIAGPFAELADVPPHYVALTCQGCGRHWGLDPEADRVAATVALAAHYADVPCSGWPRSN